MVTVVIIFLNFFCSPLWYFEWCFVIKFLCKFSFKYKSLLVLYCGASSVLIDNIGYWYSIGTQTLLHILYWSYIYIYIYICVCVYEIIFIGYKFNLKCPLFFILFLSLSLPLSNLTDLIAFIQGSDGPFSKLIHFLLIYLSVSELTKEPLLKPDSNPVGFRSYVVCLISIYAV